MEEDTGMRYIRMEMGIPGMPSPQIGVEAEIAALKTGSTSLYPDIDGMLYFSPNNPSWICFTEKELMIIGEKAAIMKRIFLENGFHLIYDKDEDEPLADGFYFTIAYPGFSGEELIEELIFYGISAISLSITGSERKEGLCACVSLVDRSQFPDLAYRLQQFHEHHGGSSLL